MASDSRPLSLALKVEMVRSGETQSSLAHKLGMTQSTFSRRMADGDWSAAQIVRLAQVLNVPTSLFFDQISEASA